MMGRVHLVVDAANVVGSRPDGWWKDRPGAARRLLHELAGAVRAGSLDGSVTVVLEGAARSGAPVDVGSELRVVHAEADGDSAIVEVVIELVAADDDGPVVVITSDRGLRVRVEAAGSSVLGPSWLWARLQPSAAVN